MDSGIFSSAAVNGLLRKAGAKPSDSRVQVLHSASLRWAIEAEIPTSDRGLKGTVTRKEPEAAADR